MQLENFQLKWNHAFCRGNPSFLSENVVLIPFDFTLKTCDVKGKNLRSSDKPGIRIGCATAMPELGVIALSEHKEKSDIYILDYPEMKTLSQLHRGNNKEYFALQFTGCEFLVSLSFKKDYEIDLWKWSTGERIYCLSFPLTFAETPDVNLSVNPMTWSELCLQSNTRICFINIKNSDDKYVLKMKTLFMLQNVDKSLEVLCKKSSSSTLFQDENQSKMLTLICHCWLPKDRMLIETSVGLLKVNPYLYRATIFNREPESKSVITSMALNKMGLFVGYETGFVDIVNISRDHWSIIETIKVGYPVKNLLLSPRYDVLAITTLKGSVSLYEIYSHELNEVLQPDCEGEIGVCVIEPLSQYCVIAKKTGCLHIFRMANGALMSGIQLKDDIITSMASSPLCSLVLIGSYSGFLHFMDATDPKRPKVVHYVRPYEAPVEHIKFENFGQFFATSAPDHHVNIWNGLPSSNFEFLGSVKILEPVKDIAMFRRKEAEATTLLVLSESGKSSEKEAGNILIRLNLPEDFAKDPKKYHIDVFKNLSYDTLCLQKWRLNYPCSKMDIHVSLGVVFYSPIVGKLQRFPVWGESSFKQTSLLKSDDVATLRISPRQRLIATVDVHGYLQVYSSSQMKLVASIPKSASAEIACRHFLDFSALGNRLVTGSERGYILCYKWTNDFFDTKIIPEWIVYCQSHSENENVYLQNMDVEETVDLKTCGTSPKTMKVLPYEELQQKLQMYIAILSFRLHRLLEIKEFEEETDFQVTETLFNDQSLYKLSDHNYKIFLSLEKYFVGEDNINEESFKNCSLIEIKAIHSTTLGYSVHNYSAIQHLSGDFLMLCDNHDANEREKTNESLNDLSFFNKGMKFKTENERFVLIEGIRKIIHDWKVEFNNTFDYLYREKENVTNRISDIVEEMKVQSSKLPSYAERDFWDAISCGGKPEHYPWEVASQSSESENSEEHSTRIQNTSTPVSRDTIQNSKSSIESLTTFAQDMRLHFDLKVERLFFKRLYCDYIIHFLELKIFCVLLFTFAEKEFSSSQTDTEKEMESVSGFVNKFDSLLNEARALEKNARQLYSRVQRLERIVSSKLEAQCCKIEDDEVTYHVFNQPPNFSLNHVSENPFWTPVFTLTPEDLSVSDLDVNCPKDVDSALWKAISSKRNRYVKLVTILRHLQFQIAGITGLILQCSGIKRKLETKHEYCKRILEDIKLLFAKLNERIHTLLTVNLENAQANLHSGPNQQTDYMRFPDLNKVPSVRDEFWQKVRMSVRSNQNLQTELEEIQGLFKTFLTLRTEVSSKLEKCRLKQISYLEELQLGLRNYKEAFSSNKIVIQDVIDEKWSLSKLLPF